jgi:hypothetical protein
MYIQYIMAIIFISYLIFSYFHIRNTLDEMRRVEWTRAWRKCRITDHRHRPQTTDGKILNCHRHRGARVRDSSWTGHICAGQGTYVHTPYTAYRAFSAGVYWRFGDEILNFLHSLLP